MADEKPVTYGSDPEFFVQRQGRIIPACGLFGGDKKKPVKVTKKALDFPRGEFFFHEDGVTVELGWSPMTYEHFDYFSKRVPTNMAAFLMNSVRADALMAWQEGFAKFDMAELERHPAAMVIGCDPDKTFTVDLDGPIERPPPDIRAFGNERYAGGHIHIGYDKSKAPAHIAAAFCDFFLRIPTMRHQSAPRKKFYGAPALHREKPYGVEYRALSNFWLLPWWGGTGSLLGILYTLGGLLNRNDGRLEHAYGTFDWDLMYQMLQADNEGKTPHPMEVSTFIQAQMGCFQLAPKVQANLVQSMTSLALSDARDLRYTKEFELPKYEMAA